MIVAVAIVAGCGVSGVRLGASRGSTIVQHVTRSSLVQSQFHKKTKVSCEAAIDLYGCYIGGSLRKIDSLAKAER